MIKKNTKVVILAAGMSSRLYPMTKDKPKCLLKIDEKAILSHQLDLFGDLGINDISIVTGYHSKKILDFIPKNIKTYYYPNYKNTNNLLTLKSISSILEGDTIITFSDLLLSKSIICDLMKSENHCTLAIDRRRVLDTTMFTKVDGNDIVDIGSHLSESDRHGNFIGISYYGHEFIKLIKDRLNRVSEDDPYFRGKYYTEVLRDLINEGRNVSFIDVAGQQVWYEIDTEDEYFDCVRKGVSNIYET